MRIRDRVAVVTGAGAGIGEALARRFAAEGAAGVVVGDLDGAVARRVAEAIGGLGVACDAGSREDVESLVARAVDRYGRVDLFCANAGVIEGPGLGRGAGDGGPFAPDDAWRRSFEVNVMSQVWAARAVLPAMLERGEGYLLLTASAAGLLTDLGSLPYSVTKHASVGLAEWLAIAYRERGVRVSCLCPMGVRTPMLDAADARGLGRHLSPDAIGPEAVADAVVAGLAEERFLILPHPAVRDYLRGKADDPDRWIAGMARLRSRLYGGEP